MKQSDDIKYLVVDARPAAEAGTYAVVVPEPHGEELGELERDRRERIYTVRGVISDHIPLVGGISDILRRPQQSMLYVADSPLSFYVHRGGWDAYFVDLVADESGQATHVEVKVEADLPSNAIRLGRGALSESLDFLSRSYELPLVLSRVDLISFEGDYAIAHELILPYNKGVRITGLGGFHEPRWFAPYDAILREANTTTSPYHRHLCACRIYEGVNWLRREMRKAARDFGVEAKLPKDPRVDITELVDLGVTEDYVQGVNTAADLFARWDKHRHQIAHFLLRDPESHFYLSSGEAPREYSFIAAISLRYAIRAINELRDYFVKHLTNHMLRGDVLPMVENRDRFVVRERSKSPPDENGER